LTGARGAAALFALALAIRLAYLVWVFDDTASLSHPDSGMWLGLAADPANWVGTHERMPFYPFFLGVQLALFGAAGPAVAIVTQLAVDAAACVAIARLAETIRPGAGLWAGLLAAFNPAQIVMAGVLLGDSLFMAKLAFAFLALARWWRAGAGEGLRHAGLVGFWFGAALLSRAVIWPFVPVLGAAMLALGLARRAGAACALRAPALTLGIVALCAAPQIARNWIEHGQAALSSQGGMHLALWVYPLTKEAADGTPFWRTFEAVRAEYEARGGGEGTRPFADSTVYASIGREGLAAIGPAGMLEAWALGAAINLASPATLMIPSVMALPRTGFYATEGASPLAKIANFLTDSSSARYLAWLAAGAALEWPVRLLALIGLALALRARAERTAAFFAVLWIGFVLAVSGPVASAKYRLPIEPLVMAFAGLPLVRRAR
jgi:4-amino-4-deoxy-L-arabinose transferase-like glycosyltransferase